MIEWSDGSIYEWSPVFRAVLAVGERRREVVVKRARKNPLDAAAIAEWQRLLVGKGIPAVKPAHPSIEVDGESWVMYPFVVGVPWAAELDQIAAAGSLLGRLHHASQSLGVPLPAFAWPDPSDESVAADCAAIATVCAVELPAGEAAPVTARWQSELNAFRHSTLPAIRDGDLPSYPVTLDFRVTNMIFRNGHELPTFVDFENSNRAPRLLDLAVAVVLFHCETTPNPGRLFDAREWVVFRDAYLAEAPALTERERERWPVALQYIRLEEGMWHLVDGSEWDWPGQRSYLHDLLQLDEVARFPLD